MKSLIPNIYSTSLRLTVIDADHILLNSDLAICLPKQNREVTLYVLLKLLFEIDQKDYFLQEYEIALNNGIAPREELSQTYQLTKTNGKLPEHFAYSFDNIQQ